MTYFIRILLLASPMFHKEKLSVVKSFKLKGKFEQISGFLLNTSEKIFFKKYFLEGQLPRPPAPQLRHCERIF